ncbi:MAG: hypothetical protein JXR36_17380 [Bacteroidales bacterium]|nr:hypothetical protein [Bacteroidales bacterium]
MSWQELRDYEKNLSSAIIGIDFSKGYSSSDVCICLSTDVSSGEFILSSEIDVDEEVFPYKNQIKLTSAELFMREYKCGLRMKTSYFFDNQKIALQIHEWGNFGIDSLNILKRTDFESVFVQIQEKITKIKGVPVDSLSNKDTYEIVWDNSTENIRLKLNNLDTSYNIKLYQYCKMNNLL